MAFDVIINELGSGSLTFKGKGRMREVRWGIENNKKEKINSSVTDLFV